MIASWEELRYQVWVGLRNLRYSQSLAGPLRHEIARGHWQLFFWQVNLFLSSLSLDYWLAYGTLLGYHRDQDLILGDADLDFALLEEDYPKVLAAREQLPLGLQLFDSSSRHGGPKLYLRRGWFTADLYFYRREPGQLRLFLNSHFVADRTPVPEELILPTQPATFLGQATRVPQQVEPLLRWTYGYLGREARQDPQTGFWHPSP